MTESHPTIQFDKNIQTFWNESLTLNQTVDWKDFLQWFISWLNLSRIPFFFVRNSYKKAGSTTLLRGHFPLSRSTCSGHFLPKHFTSETIFANILFSQTLKKIQEYFRGYLNIKKQKQKKSINRYEEQYTTKAVETVWFLKEFATALLEDKMGHPLCQPLLKTIWKSMQFIMLRYIIVCLWKVLII